MLSEFEWEQNKFLSHMNYNANITDEMGTRMDTASQSCIRKEIINIGMLKWFFLSFTEFLTYS